MRHRHAFQKLSSFINVNQHVKVTQNITVSLSHVAMMTSYVAIMTSHQPAAFDNMVTGYQSVMHCGWTSTSTSKKQTKQKQLKSKNVRFMEDYISSY